MSAPGVDTAGQPLYDQQQVQQPYYPPQNEHPEDPTQSYDPNQPQDPDQQQQYDEMQPDQYALVEGVDEDRWDLRLYDVYHNCAAAVDMLKHAGEGPFQDSPLNALEHLKANEARLYSPIPEEALPRKVRTLTDLWRERTEPRLRAQMFNEAFEFELAGRPKLPEMHPAIPVVCNDRPLSSNRVRSWPKGPWASVESRLLGAFREGRLPSWCMPPPDKENPRLQIKKRKEKELNMQTPRRGLSPAPDEDDTKGPLGADLVFVPRVYHLSEQKYVEGVARRQQIAEARKRMEELAPRPARTPSAVPQIKNPDRAASKYAALFSNPNPAEPFFKPPENSRKVQVQQKREEEMQKLLKARPPSPSVTQVPPRPATLFVPKDFVPRVYHLAQQPNGTISPRQTQATTESGTRTTISPRPKPSSRQTPRQSSTPTAPIATSTAPAQTTSTASPQQQAQSPSVPPQNPPSSESPRDASASLAGAQSIPDSWSPKSISFVASETQGFIGGSAPIELTTAPIPINAQVTALTSDLVPASPPSAKSAATAEGSPNAGSSPKADKAEEVGVGSDTVAASASAEPQNPSGVESQ